MANAEDTGAFGMNPEIVNLGAVRPQSCDPGQLVLVGLTDDLQEQRVERARLDALADGIAAGLLKRGLTAGDRVALLGKNSVNYVAALLGIMRAGLVAVPLNNRWPDAQLHYVLADSGAQLVLCDADRRAALPGNLPAVTLSDEGGNGLGALLAAGPYELFRPGERDPALILYTSGSTGRPKGVVLSHAAQLWIARTRLRDTPLDDERLLIAAPLYHMNALALMLLVLSCRGTAVLLPQFNARAYITAIGRYRCTWLTAVPPMIAMMLRELDLLRATDLDSVRTVRMGSAPVSANLLTQLRRWLPHARIINAYGTTEAGPVVFGPHPHGLAAPPMSVGHAHPGVELRLRGADGLESTEGVLEIRSPGLMLGYHNRPDLDSAFTDDGYYVTGDVFRRDEQGFYTFVGRADDMFVCGGENIYPGAVEQVLERHPAVEQACVVPVEDDIKGHKPVAFVVPRAGSTVTEDELKSFSLVHGPAYQHPRRVWFIPEMPLAAANKIDRKALLREANRRHSIQ